MNGASQQKLNRITSAGNTKNKTQLKELFKFTITIDHSLKVPPHYRHQRSQ